jgi:putative transposase
MAPAVGPQLEAAFHRRKRPVWSSWRVDDTHVRICGPWRSLHRAVDKAGQTIDLLLTVRRDERPVRRVLIEAIHHHNRPETITIDGSKANAAAIISYNTEHDTTINARQVRSLNTIVV